MNIELRTWTSDNIKGICDLMNNADRSYLSDGLPYPYTEENASWWLNMTGEKDGKTGIYRAIMMDGMVVGMVSLAQKDDVYRKDAEVSYLLSKEYWGKGIMTEAVGKVCEMAFSQLDLIRITGVIFSPNKASEKVLLKNGFVPEGIMKNAVYKNGQVMDLCYFGKYK